MDGPIPLCIVTRQVDLVSNIKWGGLRAVLKANVPQPTTAMPSACPTLVQRTS